MIIDTIQVTGPLHAKVTVHDGARTWSSVLAMDPEFGTFDGDAGLAEFIGDDVAEYIRVLREIRLVVRRDVEQRRLAS